MILIISFLTKVIIEAENGPGYLSDIAIDDVKFKAGKCEKCERTL